MSTCHVPKQNGSGKRFLSNLKKGGSFQIVLVQEMANTSVSSAHGIVTHDTSITKATLALYLWHLWVQDMNFVLLMQDAREVEVTEGYLGPRNCGRNFGCKVPRALYNDVPGSKEGEKCSACLLYSSHHAAIQVTVLLPSRKYRL